MLTSRWIVRSLLLALTLLGLASLAHPLAAQTLTGSATVQIEVDASAIAQQQAAQNARLDAMEAEHRALREALAQLAPPLSPTPDPGTPIPDPSDSDSSAPPPPVTGFSTFAVPADGLVVYVSSTDGSDRNDGLSPRRPVRSPRVGYDKLRDGMGDWLLFKAGDTFMANLGELTKSGRSAEHPMVLGVYTAEGAADHAHALRPRFLSPGGSWAEKDFDSSVHHVAFIGLHLIALHRDPTLAGYEPDPAKRPENVNKQSGIRLLGDAQDILVEDCVIQYFKFGLVFQSNKQHGYMRDIKVRRTIVRDSYGHWDGKLGGHSSGAYTQHTDGLLIEDSVFDHNGWHPHARGANRTKFNHNIYVQHDCINTTVRNTIVTRGSSYGLQLRGGGLIEDSLFVRNPIAFFVSKEQSIARNNVVLHGIDQVTPGSEPKPGDGRGMGIQVFPCIDARIENNIVSQKDSRTDFGTAINVTWDKQSSDWFPPGSVYRVTLTGNKVYKWPVWSGKMTPINVGTGSAEVTDAGDNQVDGRWLDPDRDVTSYLRTLDANPGGREASLEIFLERVTNRTRGTWDPAYSAAAVNDHIRAGFVAPAPGSAP